LTPRSSTSRRTDPSRADRGEASGQALRDTLEEIYRRLNRPDIVGHDPVGFLRGHADLRDREVVGLVAATLAYGRVRQINASVAEALGRLGPEPARAARDRGGLEAAFEGFKHRFTTGGEVAALLDGAAKLQSRHGSLGARFASLVAGPDDTTVPALARFVGELRAGGSCEGSSLLPEPSRGSACKRLHLFLRWMVRRDEVDPGGWDDVPRSKLVVPLDTHMHRIGRALGFTRRKQADLRAALEITAALREFCPEDPVKYDFGLTRLGIEGSDETVSALRRRLLGPEAR
jgi:uncharacterized protein (TIGR02757 family)